MSARRLCYLHIGTHKTGTTSIQAFLGLNEARLAELDVLLPRAARPTPGIAGHHNVPWELRGDGQFDPALGGLDQIVEELRRSGARTACLSSEDFELLFNLPGSIERLRDALAGSGFATRVVVALRPQAEYCERIYAEIRKSGYPLDFDTYVADVLRLGTFAWPGPESPTHPHLRYGPPFDYAALLDRFAASFGEDALVVRRYRSDLPDDALLRDFARLLVGAEAAAATSWTFPGRLNAISDVAKIRLTVAQVHQVELRFAEPSNRLVHRYGVLVPPVGAEHADRAQVWAAVTGRSSWRRVRPA